MKILAADDTQDICELIGDYLDLAGVEHKIVTCGSMVLQELIRNAGDYDCILLDVHMEGLDGIQTLKMIRRLPVDIPVVVITADAKPEVEVRARAAGADCFIRKPFSMEQLMEGINTVIERKKRKSGNGM